MPQKKSLLQALKADEHNQTSFLQKFVQAPSPNPPGDTSKATTVIGEYLSSKNIPYELVDVNRDGKVNVVSDFQGGKGPGPRVVLNGHVDVFPVGDGSGWSRDPWSGDIVDGRVHGRGVVDMKSGTASLIIAYAFLYERRHLLSGSVALCAVADEETGGKWGTKYLIEHDKHRWGGDLMLCAEPGGLETIRFAEKGTLRLTCTVETKGALGPYLHLTKGAIRTASAFMNEVIKSVEALPVDLPVEMERHLEKPEVKRAIDQAMGPGTTTIIARPTVNVGTIKGGLKVNMIPETCIFELDIRMPVGMREDTILELISTIIPQYEPASITIQKQAAASNRFNYSAIDHPIVDHLKDNAKSLQPDAEAPIPIPSMGGSDSKAVALGVASLHIDDGTAKHDLVISLVSFARHATIVRSATKSNTGIATTSDVSPAIYGVYNQAKAVDIMMLSDVGVDPGVHRLYTIKTVGEVLEHDGKILVFYSYCSGLPSPEASDNPLRFKFSWSPRGALLPQQNSATFLQDGNVLEIFNKDLMSKAVPYHIINGYSFLAYPNRDFVPFRQVYGIPEACTIIQGSFRGNGNSTLAKPLINLGWLDAGSRAWLKEGIKWSHIRQKLTGADSAAEADLLAKADELCNYRSPEERRRILAGLKWMRLFSDGVAAGGGSLFNTLSDQLNKLCSFHAGERDLAMLQHKFVLG
ncbi:diaminopropionate ammonia-lyase [Fusarium pseudoanthophilum]|uniref:Diaminopropionate ammonia-lyase n=1 Tax=Fusarium pseudoanthophilum TaxID=48495 RepID=A0A8H5NRL5_9HYPO|nr:diaminopropionate ammonia-lyase [Fusarium pseudoanthophilum]